MDHHTIAAAFDRLAKDGTADLHQEFFGDYARQVIAMMQVRPGHHVLEIGCGIGWATHRLGKHAPGAQSVGIDVSEAMIDRAQAATDKTSRARFERMAAESIEFPDDHFDHVVSIGCLEFTADPQVVLSEIARVTKPGAHVEIIIRATHDNPEVPNWRARLGIGITQQTTDAWCESVRATGLRVDESATLIDSRGAAAGRAEVAPTVWIPDEASRQAQHACGVLHIRASAPM